MSAANGGFQTKRYIVRGRVQGVGFRDFVRRQASALGVTGWVRNMSDGNVEVLAMGSPSQLSDLAGYLHTGPMLSEVRGVDEIEAAPIRAKGFSIQY